MLLIGYGLIFVFPLLFNTPYLHGPQVSRVMTKQIAPHQLTNRSGLPFSNQENVEHSRTHAYPAGHHSLPTQPGLPSSRQLAIWQTRTTVLRRAAWAFSLRASPVCFVSRLRCTNHMQRRLPIWLLVMMCSNSFQPGPRFHVWIGGRARDGSHRSHVGSKRRAAVFKVHTSFLPFPASGELLTDPSCYAKRMRYSMHVSTVEAYTWN